ncbi:Ger(x)C family spore germination protein [Cohnella nanjingensis]|uniref:Ger(X)C family spore germination protein n=1 Tax=Cohnella nanjingensis TaxID=1387779 RepID=A0A7X0VFV9_9BACL|nr:Ger(x)C family spore germination protein [Cohnella nanjingensis]MBB6672475.1 Ger(x)C family spore germination protein [Cohnella nanjingensis]
MNRGRRCALGLTLAAALLLPGCAGAKDIQNLAYATALGMDFVNGQYVAYVQILNFTNVARTENVQLGKEVPIWVGTGTGDTVSGAIADVGVTSQLRLYWGHLKAVVLSENVLRKGVIETYNALNRYREIRYNILMYGTKAKLMDILVQKSMFNLSPLDTIMFTAAQLNAPRSFILPVTGNRAIANLNEPAHTAMLPSLDIARGSWSEDKRNKSMFTISGAYFFDDHKMNEWMSVSDLVGFRWAERKLERTPVRLPESGAPVAVLMLIKPRLTIRPIPSDGDVRFDLSVKVQGYVSEMIKDASIAELERQASIVIRDEIKETYAKALGLKCDPFNLREAVYRKEPRLYRTLSARNPFFIRLDSIRRIDVRVHLTSTGKYKGFTDE